MAAAQAPIVPRRRAIRFCPPPPSTQACRHGTPSPHPLSATDWCPALHIRREDGTRRRCGRGRARRCSRAVGLCFQHLPLSEGAVRRGSSRPMREPRRPRPSRPRNSESTRARARRRNTCRSTGACGRRCSRRADGREAIRRMDVIAPALFLVQLFSAVSETSACMIRQGYSAPPSSTSPLPCAWYVSVRAPKWVS